MGKYRIAWMPGDGVGHDVMDAARVVLDALRLDADYVPADIGWECWQREGDALPERTIDTLKTTDCALFGAVTSKPREEAEAELAPPLRGRGLVYVSPIVRLRQLFDLHTNLRPCRSYEGNPLNFRGTEATPVTDPIDLVVFRENTEGMYAGVEFFPMPESVYGALCASPRMRPWASKGLENVSLSTRIISRQGSERICRQAFEHAQRHGRKRVTLVEKPNVLRETGGLMTRVFRDVARGYPGIASDEANIDAICMWLLKNPQDYDVLVAENMFGDIISDLCAGLVGGLGFAPSANIGDDYAVFEPTHGSAPKYAGRHVVNPMAMLLTVRMMLEWLDESSLAGRLENAIAEVIREGRVATYDVKGRGRGDSTLDVAREVARKAARA
ncbi:MAG: isocitrate/isopropylmalate dehydrogenase family protein [Phycisphaeraceae bacterium]|nr:isocitrate/isopropylmalate dehydrogenase family protein [Phycisphaeraceae bacterium]